MRRTLPVRSGVMQIKPNSVLVYEQLESFTSVAVQLVATQNARIQQRLVSFCLR